jgi:hypothetical protein
MFYLVDKINKIIFGWSPKCGCSHIKRLFLYLTSNKTSQEIINMSSNSVHSHCSNPLPNDIENYKTIIVCRNPYKRLVSGFLDKYKPTGQFRHLWKYKFMTFDLFVKELIKKSDMIEKHHFSPQTGGCFNSKILKSQELKIYDIGDIDYKYIEGIYKKEIPEKLLNKKEGHERSFKNFNNNINHKVHHKLMITYLNSNVETKQFYNDDLMKKVYKFYEKDFIFLKEHGLNYKI